MLQIIRNTVCGKLSLNAVAGASCSVSVRITALNHKTLDDTMKGQSVIELLVTELLEVLHCDRCNFRVKLSLHHTAIFHGNGNCVRLCHCNILLLFIPFTDLCGETVFFPKHSPLQSDRRQQGGTYK